MNTESYRYFLSLLDDAERIITKDPLAEKLPPCRYVITEKASAPSEPVAPAAHPAPRKSSIPRKGGLSPIALVRDCYLNCHACALWQHRQADDHPGVGTSHPLVLFVVDKRLEDGTYLEAPAMAYLESWMKALCLDKNKECHLASIIKCPGGGFEIAPECVKLFEAQVDALAPKAIVFLGEAGAFVAAQNPDIKTLRLGNRTSRYRNIPAIFTYSPEQVLQDQSLKRPVWDDLRIAGDAAGITDRRPGARKS